jgi:hypothetical protein
MLSSVSFVMLSAYFILYCCWYWCI